MLNLQCHIKVLDVVIVKNNSWQLFVEASVSYYEQQQPASPFYIFIITYWDEVDAYLAPHFFLRLNKFQITCDILQAVKKIIIDM